MTENYVEFCSNRLPCGLCRLTNQFCSIVPNKTDITCNNTDQSTIQGISIYTVVRDENNEKQDTFRTRLFRK